MADSTYIYTETRRNWVSSFGATPPEAFEYLLEDRLRVYTIGAWFPYRGTNCCEELLVNYQALYMAVESLGAPEGGEAPGRITIAESVAAALKIAFSLEEVTVVMKVENDGAQIAVKVTR